MLLSEDLKRQNAVLQAAQDDLGQLRTQLMEAHAEMENIKAIATVSETTKQEAIDEVKRQWQEEVASLQAIMKGNNQASCAEINHLDFIRICACSSSERGLLLRLGKAAEGLDEGSSQGCEKELDEFFIVSLRTEFRIHGHGNLMYMQSIFEGL